MDISSQTQKLMEDLGFADASEEQKQEVALKLQEMIDTEILYAITSRLTDEQIERLDQKLKADGVPPEERQAEFLKLLKEEMPDYEEIVGQSINNLFERVKNDALEAKNWIDHNRDKIGKKSEENFQEHEPVSPSDNSDSSVVATGTPEEQSAIPTDSDSIPPNPTPLDSNEHI